MTPAETRLSATILILRDGPMMLEVFMVERHHEIDFAEGALVFPGGKVEAGDSAPELEAFCRGADSNSENGNAVRVAAIRETFEECGVLLARPRGMQDLVDGTRLESIAARYRDELQNGRSNMFDMVRAEELELAFDLLVPFAHWITPEFMPKRFDTHFFLVEAPADQLAAHDGFESVDSIWTTIPNALELEKTGQRTIIFPTLENLKKLGRSQRVDEALRFAKHDSIVTVLPALNEDAEGEIWLEIPESSGYETVRAPMSARVGDSPGNGDKS